MKPIEILEVSTRTMIEIYGEDGTVTLKDMLRLVEKAQD